MISHHMSLYMNICDYVSSDVGAYKIRWVINNNDLKVQYKSRKSEESENVVN